jgi:hypothetical protein
MFMGQYGAVAIVLKTKAPKFFNFGALFECVLR